MLRALMSKVHASHFSDPVEGGLFLLNFFPQVWSMSTGGVKAGMDGKKIPWRR